MEKKNYLVNTIEEIINDYPIISTSEATLDTLLVKTRGEDFDLGETLDLLSDHEHEQVWKCMSIVVDRSIGILMREEEGEGEEEHNNYNIGEEQTETLVTRLKRITLLASFYFERTKYRPTYLLFVAESLHDILIPLDDEFKGTQTLKVAIARLCEYCWTAEEASAESTITQLIPYLLLASLGPSSIDADIKRVYGIRKAISLLDFEDESIESIKGLLLRCFLHSHYLKLSEGNKFLSFLFTIDGSLHAFIVGVLKPQLASGSRVVSNAYGEILLRSWKEAEGNESQVNRSSIEEIIQGFIHDSIHAADRKQFQSLRQLLGAFHADKKTKDVDPMLLRVYGPILWRSLQCANAIVRAQACTLFFDVFPLNDPTACAAEDEALKQRQFDFIAALLKDSDQRVRAAAASGVCHVFREFWECIPYTTVKQVLQFIVCTLGQDRSSVDVRYSVVCGIAELLQNPLSHGVLKILLPAMKNTIHDTSEKVRVAFVKLLCEVKGVRGIQYFDIVSEDHLLSRLSADSEKPSMCAALTELLANSYFPRFDREVDSFDTHQEKSEQVRRCMIFVKKNEKAAVAFYSHLASETSVGTMARFVSLLFSYMLDPQSEFLVASENTSSSQDGEEEDLEDDGEGEGGDVFCKKSKSTNLLLRAKRRRAAEAKKTKQVIVQAKDFDLITGILSVISAGINSICSNLGTNSTKFIIEQFCGDKMQTAFEMMSNLGLYESTVTLPILTEIWARITHLKSVTTEAAPSSPDDCEMNELITPLSIVNTFVQALSTIQSMHDRDSEDYLCLLSANATATVEMICALKSQNWLLATIKDVIVSSSSGFYALMPTDAAIELLAVFIESEKPLIVSARNIDTENLGCFLEIFNISKSYYSVGALRCLQLCFIAFEFYQRQQQVVDTVSQNPLNTSLEWFNSQVVANILNTTGDEAINDQLIMSIQLFNIVLSVISDAIMCDHPVITFSKYLKTWSHLASSSPSHGEILAPALSRACYAILSSKEETSEHSTRMDLVLSMLSSIVSCKFSSDTDVSAVMKNLTFILAFPYSSSGGASASSSSQEDVYRVVLREVLMSSFETLPDETSIETPCNFFVTLLSKQTQTVFVKLVNILCKMVLTSLQGKFNGDEELFLQPENLAFFTSTLLKARRINSRQQKLPPVLMNSIQSTLTKVASLEVDSSVVLTCNQQATVLDKENSINTNTGNPRGSRTTDGSMLSSKTSSSGDDIARRVVALLQDSFAAM